MTPGLESFLARLGRELGPERVILFGSRARGDHDGSSDYDVLIVAEAFRGVPWVERAGRVMLLWDLPSDLEVICLTPEEFGSREHDITIVGVAAREGVVVYP
jgi:predicted nucleotidyltransferase